MTINSVKDFIHTYLKNNLETLEQKYPGINSRRLLDEFLQFSDLKPDEIYLGQGSDFFSYLDRGYPLEYIQSCAYFFRSSFYVDEDVLIPRSETEILVEDSIELIKKNYHDSFQLAEIGVGSFCIGLSILVDIDKKINFWGGDISEKAIDIAKINQFRLKSKLNKDIKIDLATNDKLKGVETKFDFIVSNPPYIKEQQDFKKVHAQANEFEPHLALYLKDSEFDDWFDDLFQQVSSSLTEKGVFFMEGHEDSLVDVEKIAKKYFNKTIIKQDYTGRDRFLHAYK